MLRLERDNAHARDARITFNEKDHFYTVDSRRVVGSVSSLWASYFSGFDAPGTALRLVRRWGEREPPTDGQDPQQWNWRYAYKYERLVEKKTHDAEQSVHDRIDLCLQVALVLGTAENRIQDDLYDKEPSMCQAEQQGQNRQGVRGNAPTPTKKHDLRHFLRLW